MANAYINEYSRLASHNGDVLAMVHSESNIEQAPLTTSSIPTSSAAFTHSWVRIRADADSYAKFGSAPSAGVGDDFIEGNKTYLFNVKVGNKVSIRTVA